MNNDQYCHRHNLKLDSPKNLTARDKKTLDSIKLNPFTTTDKTGNITYGKMCYRCGFTITKITTRPLIAG